jgi:hypothetical protein
MRFANRFATLLVADLAQPSHLTWLNKQGCAPIRRAVGSLSSKNQEFGARPRRTTTRSRTVGLDFRNYLQVHGVHGGLNTFSVSVDRLYGKCIENVVLYPGTGVETTLADPAELQVLVPRAPLPATKDNVLTIPYAVTRRGGWPDRGAAIRVDIPPQWKHEGPLIQRFGRIGRERRGTSKVIPEGEGATLIRIDVLRDYNQPHAALAVNVEAKRRGFLRAHVPLLLAATLIVVAATLTHLSWRWRKTDKDRQRSMEEK